MRTSANAGRAASSMRAISAFLQSFDDSLAGRDESLDVVLVGVTDEETSSAANKPGLRYA
jgi:hypothetical protein